MKAKGLVALLLLVMPLALTPAAHHGSFDWGQRPGEVVD